MGRDPLVVPELAEAASKQAAELAYFPLWSYAHPKAIELAERLAESCGVPAASGACARNLRAGT